MSEDVLLTPTRAGMVLFGQASSSEHVSRMNEERGVRRVCPRGEECKYTRHGPRLEPRETWRWQTLEDVTEKARRGSAWLTGKNDQAAITLPLSLKGQKKRRKKQRKRTWFRRQHESRHVQLLRMLDQETIDRRSPSLSTNKCKISSRHCDLTAEAMPTSRFRC